MMRQKVQTLAENGDTGAIISQCVISEVQSDEVHAVPLRYDELEIEH